eukprot:2823012-Rhodomonas_salina.2
MLHGAVPPPRNQRQATAFLAQTGLKLRFLVLDFEYAARECMCAGPLSTVEHRAARAPARLAPDMLPADPCGLGASRVRRSPRPSPGVPIAQSTLVPARQGHGIKAGTEAEAARVGLRVALKA